MLKNYFQIALAVLKRRKFFTFISLFGISFTLTIFILLSAFVDHIVSDGYPDIHRDRELFITTMNRLSTKSGFNVSGAPSLYFLTHYVSSMKTPFRLAISSIPSPVIQYVNDKKLMLGLKYTNAQFWDVLQFQFSEGGPYSQKQLENAEKVAVISEVTRDNYFGKDVPAVGKYIEVGNSRYRVSGVVRTVPFTQALTHSDIYVPYTLSAGDMSYTGPDGKFTGILLLNSPADIPAARGEYDHLLSQIPVNGKEYDRLASYGDTYLEYFVRSTPIGDHNAGSGLGMFYLILGILSFVLLFLPAINLVNINVSRILERSSEIGVRKSFGASSGTLVLQFLTENFILTGIGCLIGIVVSAGIIFIINQNDWIANVRLAINGRVLGYSLLSFLVFGFLSGVYPAWRMSRMHIVAALKVR
jgi:putative ABC transport system permease protein